LKAKQKKKYFWLNNFVHFIFSQVIFKSLFFKEPFKMVYEIKNNKNKVYIFLLNANK
jgi:hypothetical protein